MNALQSSVTRKPRFPVRDCNGTYSTKHSLHTFKFFPYSETLIVHLLRRHLATKVFPSLCNSQPPLGSVTTHVPRHGCATDSALSEAETTVLSAIAAGCLRRGLDSVCRPYPAHCLALMKGPCPTCSDDSTASFLFFFQVSVDDQNTQCAVCEVCTYSVSPSGP
mgnify:CR=1 FL=1